MLNTLKLLLPALIPSWRFFDRIASSPRIEFARLEAVQAVPNLWQEFCPRPPHLPLAGMLKRLFWNPRWNEMLFLVSCAERLMENPTEQSEQEIVKRIRSEPGHGVATPYLQFRLVFVSRHGSELQKETTFMSRVHSSSESAAS